MGIRAGDSVIVERGAGAARAAPAAAAPAAPAAPSAPHPKAAPVDDVSVHVPLGDAAVLTLKTVPDDNSCLYNALSFLQHQRIAQEHSQGLRELAAAGIRENPAEYPDAVLGEARDTYIAKLLRPTTWGGALEIAVFAQTLRVEIWCWDIQSGVCHRFGEGQGFENVWLLAYSGIHYDALIALPEAGTPLEWATTTFPHTDAALLVDAGTRLAETLRSRH